MSSGLQARPECCESGETIILPRQNYEMEHVGEHRGSREERGIRSSKPISLGSFHRYTVNIRVCRILWLLSFGFLDLKPNHNILTIFSWHILFVYLKILQKFKYNHHDCLIIKRNVIFIAFEFFRCILGELSRGKSRD